MKTQALYCGDRGYICHIDQANKEIHYPLAMPDFLLGHILEEENWKIGKYSQLSNNPNYIVCECEAK